MDTDRLKGKAQDIGGSVQEFVGRASDDFGTQAEGVARQVAGKTQDLYGQAKDSLRGASEVVSDYAGQAYDQSDTYARRGREVARQQIGENPLTAIMLAGAVGYLLAVILHGRA